MDQLLRLFDTEGFPARWHCGTGWTPALGWTHIISDALIWASYTAIPILLAIVVIRRRNVPFPRIAWLFIAFIFFCGTSHLIEAIIFWEPVYRLAGLVKFATAAISIATVFALIPVIPSALSLRSPQQLEMEVSRRTQSLRESEARQRAMRGELDHRVKNNITAIISLAEQTIASTDDLDQFQEAFIGRLSALAHTHDALSAAQWTGADVHNIINLTLKPYQSNRQQPLTIEGPAVTLDARAASSLCMAVHELATNSVKYGALSIPTGTVDVRWDLGDEILEIRWTDRNGPPVAPPEREGFGSQLLRGMIEFDLEGEVVLDFAPDGLKCTMRIPQACIPPADPETDPEHSPPFPGGA